LPVLTCLLVSPYRMDRHFDSLPRLQSWDSPKGRSRLRVSSALVISRELRSLVARGTFGPARLRKTRSVFRTTSTGRIPLHGRVCSRRVPPFAPDPWAGTRRSGSPALLPGWRGREAPVGAEAPAPQPGNAVTHQYGRAGLNGSGQHSRPVTERWPALPCRLHLTAKAVGFRLVVAVIT